MKKVGIEVEMIDSEMQFIPLDEIIFVKVEHKNCYFFLKRSTPEATITLTEVWNKIQKAGKGYEHNLIKLSRNVILNLDCYDKYNPSKFTVILKREPYTIMASEVVKKAPKKELPKGVMEHVQAIAKSQGLLEKKKEDEIQEVPLKYYEVEIGETPFKKLKKILKESKKIKVLENYAPKKELKVSIEDLNGDLPKEAGHEYVDLGLTSGTLWSTHNLGEYDKDAHSFYGWGELYESDSYDWEHYTAFENNNVPKQLDPSHDVAHKCWGGNWRMPTYHDFSELAKECILTWCSKPKGCLVTSTTNGNRIFLPAYGYKQRAERNELMGLQGTYWTSSTMRKRCGTAFQFKEDDLSEKGLGLHSNSKIESCLGLSVRPVLSKKSDNAPVKGKKTVMILRPYRFDLNTPFDSVSWNPEGWKVEKPWLMADPIKALDYIKDLCKKVRPDVIVSVGSASFFCKQLKGYPRICLNPNYLPSDDLAERKELIKNPKTPQTLIDEYRKVEKNNLMARGEEKCVVVYGQPDDDEVYPTWDDPALESWERIDVDPWATPRNWMNTFLYPLIEKMI